MQEQVGRYKVLGRLGKGGMGVVYLAEDPMLNRRVAIKTINLATEDADRKEFLVASLLKDARAAAGLSHPHIVSVYDVFEEGDSAYLVLEYVAGQSLAQRLAAGPTPDRAFSLRVLREMAGALDYTHARSIVHRDIKPANVLLDAQGSVKITDFGIARINDNRTRTNTGTIVGTIEYMAPEQVTGGAIDGRADQVSLAAVAYEMLTGSTLFGNFSFTTLAYKIVNEMPPPARSHNPELPVGVDAVLSRALSKAPADRYATCGEFIVALEQSFAAPVSQSDVPTLVLNKMVMDELVTHVSARPALVVQPRRTRWPIAAGLAVALLGGALLVWKPWTPAVVTEAPTVAKQEAAPAPPPQPKPATRTSPIVDARKPEAGKAAVKTEVPPPPAPAKADDDPLTVPEPAAPNLPANVMTAYNMGVEYMKAGRFPAAVEAFNVAIRLKPDNGMAYAARAAAFTRLGQPQQALKDVNEALRLNPRDPMALGARGNLYASQNQTDLALADLTASLAISPMAIVYNRRGMIYLDQKDYARAIGDFTAAIQKAPDFLPAYRSRHQAYLAINDRPRARADMMKIVSLGGGRKPGRK